MVGRPFGLARSPRLCGGLTVDLRSLLKVLRGLVEVGILCSFNELVSLSARLAMLVRPPHREITRSAGAAVLGAWMVLAALRVPLQAVPEVSVKREGLR